MNAQVCLARTGFLLLSIAVVAYLLGLTAPALAEVVRVGGTGIGLGFSKLIGEDIAAGDPTAEVQVLPSMGTSGGIKALMAGDIEVAIATRGPNAEERAKGLREGACLTTALVFATSRPKAPGIELSQLPSIYSNPAAQWPDGKPLKVILRARGGSENPYLIKLVPGMEAALQAAYERRGVPTGSTDQENADLAHRTEGSFAIVTLMQIRSERLQLTPLSVNGIEPTPVTLADRTYPMPLQVCFLVKEPPAAGAVKFIKAISSPTGRELARHHGAIVAD